MMPLAYPTKEQKMARVIKTEEKGSDVNLAAYLLSDAMREICDCAVVVTNDSDISVGIKVGQKVYQRSHRCNYAWQTLYIRPVKKI